MQKWIIYAEVMQICNESNNCSNSRKWFGIKQSMTRPDTYILVNLSDVTSAWLGM